MPLCKRNMIHTAAATVPYMPEFTSGGGVRGTCRAVAETERYVHSTCEHVVESMPTKMRSKHSCFVPNNDDRNYASGCRHLGGKTADTFARDISKGFGNSFRQKKAVGNRLLPELFFQQGLYFEHKKRCYDSVSAHI